MVNALKNAGTRFPFINLQKSVERAKLLFDADQRGRDVSSTAVFEVWGYSGKSSGGFQTVAALKSYGLLKQGADGDLRKLALSEDALRYFRDERPEEKVKFLKQFALKPKLLAALWADWGASPPADTIARSHLKTEAGLNDQSARSLLAIYKENLAFAELKGGDKVSAQHREQAAETEDEAPNLILVGEYVQWATGGVEQFPTPRRVNWVSDDGRFARVHGSTTGIPVNELTVVEAPKPPPSGGLAANAGLPPGVIEVQKKPPDINILMTGQRLEITADVDLEGVAKLKEALGKYEELLKLLQ
jgi:hypothetical protein